MSTARGDGKRDPWTRYSTARDDIIRGIAMGDILRGRGMKEKYKAKIAVFVTLISQFCLLNGSVIYVNIRTVSKYCVLLFKYFHNFNLGGALG